MGYGRVIYFFCKELLSILRFNKIALEVIRFQFELRGLNKKNTREITDHHVLRMFRKCRMLNLTFLRDSYVTWERRRLQITKFQAFGGLLGTFGDHFGSILGTFSAHFGGPERTWKHIAYKRGGGDFGLMRFGPKNDQNWGFLVPEKFQNRDQNVTKEGNKNIH